MLTGDGPQGTKSATWVNIPQMLAEHGVGSFLFDFEGLGHSDGQRRNLSLSVGLSNLKDAMLILSQQPKVDQERIAIFGSSFGGNIAILHTADTASIRCLGLKSPVSFYPDSFYGELGDVRMSRWAEERYLDDIGFNYEFYLDAFRYNTYDAAMRIHCNCLITHGSADKVVPLVQSKHLAAALVNAPSKELRILDGVGHGYSEPGAWDQMAALFVWWFVEQLR